MIDIVVGPSLPRTMALQASGLKIPLAQSVRALIDTGASCTCIDPEVFSSLQLSPTGSTPVLTPTTGAQPVQKSLYDVGLMIPNATPGEAPLFIPSMPVLESELLLGQGFHVLIGTDVLRLCTFSYNGRVGTFTLSYELTV